VDAVFSPKPMGKIKVTMVCPTLPFLGVDIGVQTYDVLLDLDRPKMQKILDSENRRPLKKLVVKLILDVFQLDPESDKWQPMLERLIFDKGEAYYFSLAFSLAVSLF